MDVGHTSAEEDERWAQLLKDLKLKFIMDDGQVTTTATTTTTNTY